MSFKFVTDRIVRDRAYPAFAQHSAKPYTPEWREFAHRWPYTVPVELIEHCRTHNYPYELYTVDQDFPAECYYPIGLGFFDFTIDYFDLLSRPVRQHLTQGRLQLLFYYHEGDNPRDIKRRLDELCQLHNLPKTCYQFISGNTQAANLTNAAYFPDHELLYWQRNQLIPATKLNYDKKYAFTLLSRQHKWWRATVVADLHRANLLNTSKWSYNTLLPPQDLPEENPIEIDTLDIQDYLKTFINNGPYRCDQLTDKEHNDHHKHVQEHYTESYCSIVVETHFDADSTPGTFLTEKTFKPIKHGHPYVLIAPPGSLQLLRDLGYRTFDHVIDNSYDTITDNTERYLRVKHTIEQIKNNNNLTKWLQDCSEDILHNQRLFTSNKYTRIANLYNKLEYNRNKLRA